MKSLDNSKYKWLGTWGIHVLKQGTAHEARRFVDFDCEPTSFVGVIHNVARLRGLSATTTVIGASVIFAFYKPDGYTRPNLKAYPVVRKARGE